jgi:polysaccharide biosynthesis transport protein
VTSTAPYEGKSTTALALARSYAMSKRRVLLIDCDLRKPSMHKLIGVEPTRGLRDFLAQDGDAQIINKFVVADPQTPLTLVLATRNSSQPTDQLLASSMFRNMIEMARRMFDVVVLDTPPVGPVVDGLYIAPHADTILFLTRWAVTPQSDVKTAIASLRRDEAATA